MVSGCTPRPADGAACPAAVESSAGAGVGEHPYPPRGCGGICPPGHAVFDRQGFLRNAPPGTEGVFSRQDSFSSAAYRHQLQIPRSEEHTSELQSQSNLVCRLLLEKKKSRPLTLLLYLGDRSASR